MSEVAPTLSEDIKALAEECNDRHVMVVQAILSGEYGSNTAAYMSVYPDSDHDAAKSSVGRMLTIANVKALHHALKDEKVMEGVLSRAEAMKILSDMASTNLGDIIDFMTVECDDQFTEEEDENGETVMVRVKMNQSRWQFKNSDDLSEKQLRSISELAATKEGFKIKQHDQKVAIKQLAEMRGWNEPKKIDIDVGDSAYLKRLQESLGE